MKPKRTPQEQYDSLNKTRNRINRVSLCIMPLWCACLWVFALMEHHPLWAALVVLALSVCVFMLRIVFSIFSVKLCKLKETDGALCDNGELS